MEDDTTVTKEHFAKVVLPLIGAVNVDKYTLDNGFMSVEIINFGATVISIKVPNSKGEKSDILLGYDSIYGYLSSKNPYLGATIGRYGHTIAGAAFTLNDLNFFLSRNNNGHTYHGGIQGFDKKVWDAKIDENCLVMYYKSYDLEQGFPGDLLAKAKFILTSQNQLIVVYSATSSAITPANIINQLYFNLAGEHAGPEELFNHEIKVYSDYCASMVKDELLPTGEVEEVTEGSDLRNFKNLKTLSEESSDELLKLFYCIEGLGIRSHAKLRHRASGRSVQVYSDGPCCYVSFADKFPDAYGKDGRPYKKMDGICLQSGNFPDAVHFDGFPSPWVQPKKEYKHTLIYKFRVQGLASSDDEDGDERKATTSSRGESIKSDLKCIDSKDEDIIWPKNKCPTSESSPPVVQNKPLAADSAPPKTTEDGPLNK